MFLKRIEIQGFKTFVNRTVFEFGPGVTAVVGPNGSGKSNLADAIRWALGEQNPRLLRIRRAEDVIFAGSGNRSPVGLAEVTLLFENTDGRLFVDSSEVSLTRRLLRSGESEYLINRQRVRLRDLTDLLLRSNIGSAGYTVVGQGMVEHTINQRPEERRSLFEEAADVRRLYIKLDESRDHLAKTRENLVRVEDVLTQLEPELSRLEEQASRAGEYERLTQSLAELLEAWYRVLWSRAIDEVRHATAAVDRAQAEVRSSAQAVADAEATVRSVSSAVDAARSRLVEHRQRLAMQLQEAARLEATITAGLERRRMLETRRQELEDEIADLVRQAEETEKAAAVAEVRTEELRRQEEEAAGEATRLEGEAQRLSREATEAERRVLGLEGERMRRQAEAEAARAELGRIEQRKRQLNEEVRAVRERLENASARQAANRAALVEIQQRLDRRRSELTATEESLEEARKHRDDLRRQARQAEESLLNAKREQRRLSDHAVDLERRSGTGGPSPGVRAVLAASRRGDGRLDGVIGTVAQIIRAPEALETAIEAALGGRLQDVVVESWVDAEAAIEFLKRERAGRVTFLPLDTLRPSRPFETSGPGIVGNAARLVEADSRYQVVVDLALGGTVVVEDLGVARRLLNDVRRAAGRQPSQIVTLAGEIVRPSGVVTGGYQQRAVAGGLLALERERREVQGRLEAAELQAQSLSETLALLTGQEREAADRLSSAEHEERNLRRDLRSIEDDVQQAERQARSAQHDVDALSQTIVRHERELEDLETALQQRNADLARIVDVEPTEAAAKERQRLEAIERRREEVRGLVGAAHQRLAHATAELKQQLAEQNRYAHEVRRIRERTEERRRRLSEVAAEIAAAGIVDHEQTEQLDLLKQQVASLEAEITALGEQAAGLESKRDRCAERLSELRLAHGRADEQQTRALLARERAETERQALIERMAADGFTPPANDLPGIDRQLLLVQTDETATGEMKADLGNGSREADFNPDTLRRRIDRVRAQIRGLGPINAQAAEEFAAASERHEFLTRQLNDLRSTERQLRQAMVDLETVIARQFHSAFEEANAEFRRAFAALFGGGTARLVLTAPDNVSATGIDIEAQPPGKRMQPIPLLSGGEKALTAVALLFALLKVNPTPFCVLDEVDAALDESNVGRFADLMRRLSESIQFIIVSHNRATMERADSLYGISLSPNGYSIPVSLRLESPSGV